MKNIEKQRWSPVFIFIGTLPLSTKKLLIKHIYLTVGKNVCYAVLHENLSFHNFYCTKLKINCKFLGFIFLEYIYILTRANLVAAVE